MFSPFLLVLFIASLAIASVTVGSRGHGYGIVGGEPAKITELPHQVYLKRKHGSFFCGGSIISRSHILTAGHCARNQDDDIDIEVVLGTDDRTAGDGVVHEVSKVSVHENITLTNYEISNDIAVLTLAKKIKLSKKARIIPLAKPNHQVKDGAELTVSGWGRTSSSSYLPSDILRKVIVSRVAFDTCKKKFADFYNKTVTENMLCFKGANGEGAFHGDSGGPVIQKTKQGYLQVGVVSWGHPYHELGFPDVSTQVSKYYKWIKKILKKDLEQYF